MRLIDASALKDNIYAMYRTAEQIPGLEINEHLILLAIDNASTIDAVPVVRGEWIAFDGDNTERPYNWICSSCGGGCVDNRTTYCHDCGAKLREDGE